MVMQMNANQLTKIPVEKLSDTLQFLIAENEIPLSDALKQVIDDVDAVCKKLLRDESAPAQPVIPEHCQMTPDEMLCDFYEVSNWPDLVRELVKHVEQLQESAKRNVKPWEDTFPETLLPAYVDRITRDNDACRAEILKAQLVSEPYKLPELNDELIEILGRPNFTCTKLAECLRKCGQEIKRKSEYEQAAILHVLLNLYIKHGNDWRKHAEEAFTPAPAQEGE